MRNHRRALLRLGAMLLLGSAAFGLAAAIPLPHPERWMVAHTTAIMLGTLVMVQGLVWNDLRLSQGQLTWLVRLIQVQVGFGVVFGIVSAVLNIPGPASAPGVAPTGIQGPVLGLFLAIIIPSTIASWVLLFMGLRGNDA
jgi:hypothetical protein